LSILLEVSIIYGGSRCSTAFWSSILSCIPGHPLESLEGASVNVPDTRVHLSKKTLENVLNGLSDIGLAGIIDFSRPLKLKRELTTFTIEASKDDRAENA
jgi:hypothetical protein